MNPGGSNKQSHSPERLDEVGCVESMQEKNIKVEERCILHSGKK